MVFHVTTSSHPIISCRLRHIESHSNLSDHRRLEASEEIVQFQLPHIFLRALHLATDPHREAYTLGTAARIRAGDDTAVELTT